jgi:ABC-type branched-subunit amino acid transport system permease subunit
MRSLDRTDLGLALAFAALLALGPLLPTWAVFLVTVSLAKGLVALGLLLLMRAGLVSFGQGLYYALGAYAGGVAAERYGVGEAVAMVALGVVAAAAVAAGWRSWRPASSPYWSWPFMILYGLFVKTRRSAPPTVSTWPPHRVGC